MGLAGGDKNQVAFAVQSFVIALHAMSGAMRVAGGKGTLFKNSASSGE